MEGQFDLTLEMMAMRSSLSGVFKYNPELYEEASIARMVGHFKTLLAAIVTVPQQSIATLPLLTSAEQQQLLAWHNTQVDYPESHCLLHQLIEAQVDKTPDACAVVFENQQLTYRQLNEKANQLAHYLQTLGVGPDGLVGISMARCLEMVIGLLGILKAGGAYMPLEPDYPAERLAFMLADSQIAILLTRGMPEWTLNKSIQVIDLTAYFENNTDSPCAIQSQSDAIPQPDNLAYTIYTSGSTGQPKGAMNTHLGIVNRLLWMQDTYQLTSHDCVLQKTPFSFDVSVWEFFWPLIAGARLVIAKPGCHQDSTYLAQLIAEQQITTLHFVPSMLQVFLDTPDLENHCHALKRVICSGEALSVELQNRFLARFSHTALYNLYGPTEAAIDVTFWHCQPNSDTVPIGKPIANTQIHILAQYGQAVPIGKY